MIDGTSTVSGVMNFELDFEFESLAISTAREFKVGQFYFLFISQCFPTLKAIACISSAFALSGSQSDLTLCGLSVTWPSWPIRTV